MSDKITAKKLCKLYRLNFKHALYLEDGTWYHHLEDFPGALLDKAGYVVFPTKQAYESCKYLRFGKEVNVRHRQGIKSIPGYTLFPNLDKTNSINYSNKPDEKTKVSDNTFLTEFNEGGAREIVLEIQSRNPQVRRTALKHYGTVCQVCGFDFGKTYGLIGEGFIEVHHLKPLSLSNNRTIITLEDVAVVCSNCHRMLHRNGIRPLSIKELSDLLKVKRAP